MIQPETASGVFSCRKIKCFYDNALFLGKRTRKKRHLIVGYLSLFVFLSSTTLGGNHIYLIPISSITFGITMLNIASPPSACKALTTAKIITWLVFPNIRNPIFRDPDLRIYAGDTFIGSGPVLTEIRSFCSQWYFTKKINSATKRKSRGFRSPHFRISHDRTPEICLSK
jgi:hypothetical protein